MSRRSAGVGAAGKVEKVTKEKRGASRSKIPLTSKAIHWSSSVDVPSASVACS